MALPKVVTALGAFKELPPSVKPFFKPMLLISLGLHTAILLIPLPAPPKKAETPKPKAIKIVNIPTPRLSPKPLAQKQRQQKRTTQTVRSPFPQKALVLTKKPPNTTTPNSVPTPLEEQLTPTDPPNPSDRTWSNLPNYPKNLQTCDGVTGCQQTGDSFENVIQYFENALSKQKIKFSIAKSGDSYETKYRAYKVLNQKNESKFLSILFNGENTKYVWANRIASETDIVTKTATPSDLATLIGQLPSNFNDASKAKLSPERFPDGTATKFYIDRDTPEFGFKNTRADAPTIVSSNPTETYQTLSDKLSSFNYSASRISDGYAGGILYEITKSDLPKPLYITILATKQGDGSIVALWLDMPR